MISVITSLALTRLLSGCVGLYRHAERVRFSWRHGCWTAMAFLLLLGNWGLVLAHARHPVLAALDVPIPLAFVSVLSPSRHGGAGRPEPASCSTCTPTMRCRAANYKLLQLVFAVMATLVVARSSSSVGDWLANAVFALVAAACSVVALRTSASGWTRAAVVLLAMARCSCGCTCGRWRDIAYAPGPPGRRGGAGIERPPATPSHYDPASAPPLLPASPSCQHCRLRRSAALLRGRRARPAKPSTENGHRPSRDRRRPDQRFTPAGSATSIAPDKRTKFGSSRVTAADPSCSCSVPAASSGSWDDPGSSACSAAASGNCGSRRDSAGRGAPAGHPARGVAGVRGRAAGYPQNSGHRKLGPAIRPRLLARTSIHALARAKNTTHCTLPSGPVPGQLPPVGGGHRRPAVQARHRHEADRRQPVPTGRQPITPPEVARGTQAQAERREQRWSPSPAGAGAGYSAAGRMPTTPAAPMTGNAWPARHRGQQPAADATSSTLDWSRNGQQQGDLQQSDGRHHAGPMPPPCGVPPAAQIAADHQRDRREADRQSPLGRSSAAALIRPPMLASERRSIPAHPPASAARSAKPITTARANRPGRPGSPPGVDQPRLHPAIHRHHRHRVEQAPAGSAPTRPTAASRGRVRAPKQNDTGRARLRPGAGSATLPHARGRGNRVCDETPERLDQRKWARAQVRRGRASGTSRTPRSSGR